MTVPEEFAGCARACIEQGEHTSVWGQCEKAAPPPCKHPTDQIAWSSRQCQVVCGSCQAEVTLEGLLEAAQAAMAYGCRCDTQVCTADCWEGRPVGWTLDPDKVRAVLAAQQEGTRKDRSLMVTLPAQQWSLMEAAARELRCSAEEFCRIAVLRRIRDFQRYWD